VAQKRGIHFSLARHYDKVLAVMVLAALLISLFILARSASEGMEWKRRYEQGVRSIRPKAPNLEPASIGPYETALRRLRQPQAVRLAFTNEAGVFTPQARVWCVDCTYPIPFAATDCPYCKFPQPKLTEDVAGVIDSEGKGIPDEWRKRNFNHAFALAEDRSRAEDDADEDGFSNLDEWKAGTAPRDPKDHSDWMLLVRYKDMTTRPYPFLFTGVNKMPGGELQMVVNLRVENQRTCWVKRGEQIGKTGLVYSNCIAKVETVVIPGVGPQKKTRYEAELFRPADGKHFLLRDNEPNATLEQDVVLTLTLGEKTREYRAAVDGTLEMEGEKYKVGVNLGVDGKPASVVLENVRTAKKTIVTVGLP
jgi:hypothetical protein